MLCGVTRWKTLRAAREGTASGGVSWVDQISMTPVAGGWTMSDVSDMLVRHSLAWFDRWDAL